jgi:hypothetical protein
MLTAFLDGAVARELTKAELDQTTVSILYTHISILIQFNSMNFFNENATVLSAKSVFTRPHTEPNNSDFR